MPHGDVGYVVEHCAACELEHQLARERLKYSLLGSVPKPVRAGAFELQRCLGLGSAGVVFEAIALRSGARVALKHFHTTAVARDVKREFRSLAHVTHPNLVRLDELFAHDGHWFLTMELVIGRDFMSHLRHAAGGRRFDDASLRDALAQLLRGVAAIHAAGLVHLDLKPANALVEADGRVVVLDYGLCYALGGDANADAHWLGTPDYMAPEQRARQKPEPASDLYAVGVMLYEALTGDLPPRAGGELLVASGAAPDLEALCRALLHVDPGARPSAARALQLLGLDAGPGAARLASSPPIARTDPTPSSVDPFVGRGAQLARLHAEWMRARAGQFRLVLIEGESGIGKTTLLRRFCREARAMDALVLAGRCHQREHIPYNVFEDIVEQLGRRLSQLPEQRARVLPRHLAALARVFPSLRTLSALEGADPALPAASEDPLVLRLQAFAALRELLARVCALQPVVLAIDDAHWGDLDSARLLQSVFAAPDAPPVLMLAAQRSMPRAPSAFAEGSLRALACAPARLQLEAFTAEEAHQLVLALHGASSTLDSAAILRDAKGVPFFVHELASYRAERVEPPGAAPELAELLQERAQRCSAPARALLEVIAVAGRPLPLSAALAAAGLPESAQAAAGELCDVRLAALSREPVIERIEVYHDRVQQTLTAAVDEARVQQLHARIADALDALQLGDPEEQVRHRRLAGDFSRARELALLAAERSAAQFAWNRAAALLENALDLPGSSASQRRDLLAQKALALSYAGKHSDAADAYLGLSRSDDDARLAARELFRAGRISEGMALVGRLAKRFGWYVPALDQSPYLMYLRARASVAMTPLTVRKPGPGKSPDAISLAALGSLLPELLAIDPVRSRIVHAQFYRRALRSGDPQTIRLALLWEIVLLGYLAGTKAQRRLDRLLRALDELARREDDPRSRALYLYGEGFIAYVCSHQPQRALAAFRLADRMLAPYPELTLELQTLVLARSIVAELTGDIDDMTSIASHQPRDLGVGTGAVPSILVQGVPLSLLAANRPDDATRFLELYRPSAALPLLEYFHVVRSSDVATYAGDHAGAAAVIDELRPRLRGSLLARSPLFQQSFAFYVARSAFFKYLETRDPRWKRDILAQRKLTRDGRGTYYNRGFVSLVTAALALAEQREDDARPWLRAAIDDFAVSQASQGESCARYRLAQLERDEPALRSAVEWFRARGVVDVERWVSVWAPVAERSSRPRQ